jgi:hypothetical protein
MPQEEGSINGDYKPEDQAEVTDFHADFSTHSDRN